MIKTSPPGSKDVGVYVDLGGTLEFTPRQTGKGSSSMTSVTRLPRSILEQKLHLERK
ncbi:hypothetical protein GCM10023155_10130 [Bremerella cremea]